MAIVPFHLATSNRTGVESAAAAALRSFCQVDDVDFDGIDFEDVMEAHDDEHVAFIHAKYPIDVADIVIVVTPFNVMQDVPIDDDVAVARFLVRRTIREAQEADRIVAVADAGQAISIQNAVTDTRFVWRETNKRKPVIYLTGPDQTALDAWPQPLDHFKPMNGSAVASRLFNALRPFGTDA